MLHQGQSIWLRLKNSIAGLKPSRRNALVYLLVFALIGGVSLLIIHAISPYVAVEPESGTRTGPATVVNDSNASGGKYVQYGTSTTVKPVLQGVLDEQGLPAAADLGNYGGGVIAVKWDAVQPTGSSDFNTSNIDSAVTAAQSYNSTHPNHQVGLKLRVFVQSTYLPAWVATDAGTFPATQQKGGTSVPLAKFWTTAYATDYTQLITKLSDKYDSAPEVRDIAVSMCSMFFEEPMVRWTNVPETNTAILGAGYTLAKDDTCQKASIDIFKTAFTHTHVSYASNPYQGVYGTSSAPQQYKATYQSQLPAGLNVPNYSQNYMDYCRTGLGKRCGLGNNESGRGAVADTVTVDQVVADPSLCQNPPGIGDIYVYEKSKPDLYYQSENPDPTTHGAIAADIVCGELIAIRQGGNYTELPVNQTNSYYPGLVCYSGPTCYEPAWNTALTANTAL